VNAAVPAASTLASTGTPASPKRGRGRPAGARSRVLADGRALGPHHIAFLRAWFQGLDLRIAWEHYLAFAVDSSDARVIESTRTALLRSVLAAGHQAELSRPELNLKPALDLITQAPFTPASAPIPSLDDWIVAEGIDPEFSEAELLELYREHYGLDTLPDDGSEESAFTPQKPDVSSQVKALNLVAGVIIQAPSPSDRLAMWLSPNLAAAVQASGATTLEQLVAMINIYGYNWHKQVAGLGATRAHAIARWLTGLNLPEVEGVRATALLPPQRHKLLQEVTDREVSAPPRYAIGPLEQLRVPPEMSGITGRFRQQTPNTLDATTDLQAIQAWLLTFERVHTNRSYRKEVERFYLWCLFVLRKPLSSVSGPDCRAYRDFLAKIPADWIQTAVLPKGHPGWRPFRKQLAPSSQKQALVIVQALYTGLEDAGYQVANPMRAVMKSADLPSSSIDLTRSLTRAEWDYLTKFARSQPESDEQRRDVLLLELLSSTGLRLDELANATTEALEQVEVDESDDSAWILHVVGKRQRERMVLIHDDVRALIDEHHRDQERRQIVLPPFPALVGALHVAPPRWKESDGEVRLVHAEQRQALSGSGIYRALKRLFGRAAAAAGGEVDGRRLEAASTHWLRHTFARQQLREGAPLEVVQEALGHASLATTGVYATSERSRIIRELKRARESRLGRSKD